MKTWQKLKQDPSLFERYFVKEYTIKAIRKFFEERGYHELESPILSPALPQERYLDVLETKIDLADGSSMQAYLIPTTETWNKKILVAGLGNHFVITKVFRALEEISPNHSPEFTMLEWYELGNTYMDLMDSTEELVRFIIQFLAEKGLKRFGGGRLQGVGDSKLNTTPYDLPPVTYQGQTINFGKKWHRVTVRDALREHVGVELEDIQELEDLKKLAESLNFKVLPEDDWQAVFEMIWASKVEPHFPADVPTFVYDYPRILCPLTKVKESDPLVSEKVEVFIAGRELGNGYTELLDWEEQERRFKGEQAARAEMGRSPIAYDQDFVDALKAGMPPVAGIGMGLDRLVMILADAKSISDINYFPASEWQ